VARCRETAGFLFSHPCNRGDVARCKLCEKPICEKHVRALAGNRVCVSCHKERTKADGQEDWMRDDPHYYSAYYYRDYDNYSSYDRYSMADRDAFDGDSNGGWNEDWGDNWEDDYDGS
jgi:hypothetical protein